MQCIGKNGPLSVVSIVRLCGLLLRRLDFTHEKSDFGVLFSQAAH